MRPSHRPRAGRPRDGGWNCTRAGELGDIQEALEALSPAELDAAIAALSDDELRTLYDELDDGWLGSGWDTARRREFHEIIMQRASGDTITRLAQFTDELQPGFDGVAGDDAAGGGAGEPIYAEYPLTGVDRDGDDVELWPMIIEKAYARYEHDHAEIEGGRRRHRTVPRR